VWLNSQIIAGKTLNAVSDSTFAATRMNVQGWTADQSLVLHSISVARKRVIYCLLTFTHPSAAPHGDGFLCKRMNARLCREA